MPLPPRSSAIAVLLAWVSCCLPAPAATVPGIDFLSPHATYPTGSVPNTVAAGHLLAGATVMDIAVGNQGVPYSVTVLLNGGTGAFTSPPALALPGPAESIAIVDLGNGQGDIVVACAVGTVSVFIGNGDGTFNPRVDYTFADSPIAMRVVDVTGDHHPDVLVGCSASIQFLKGNGDGTLVAAVAVSTGTTACESLAVGDLTGSGTMDIAATLDGAPYTLAGNGDGTFSAPVACSTPALSSLSIGIGDFNGDHLNDIAVTDMTNNQVHILLNQGGGVFAPSVDYAVGHYPKSLIPIDLNGDLRTDLVFVNVDDGTIGYLQGNGDGTFQAMIAYSTGNGPYIDAAGDFSGDGRLDLVTANGPAETVSVLIQGTGAAPAAIADLASPNSTGTTVSLTWTTPLVETLGPAAGYQLRWSTSPITAGTFATATLVAPPPPLGSAGGPATCTVPGLLPLTTYHFAIESSDAFGRTSAISNVITMATTTDSLPPSAVADLVATAYGERTVRLSWTAPSDGAPGDTVTAYQLRWSTAPITALNVAAATLVALPAPGAPGASETAAVSGLAAGTTYYFALASTDAAALTSALSNLATATTASSDTIPPATVGDLAASATVDGATLTWTAPGDDGSYGTAASYQLRYSTVAITAGTFAGATLAAGVPAPQPAGSAESVTVGGLTPGVTYWFALEAVDAAANASALSNVVSAVPTAPGGAGGGSTGGGSTAHGCGLGGGAAALVLLTLMAALQLRRRRRAG